METIIRFKDGHEEKYKDTFPAFTPEDGEMDLVERDGSVYGDTISIELVKEVVWSNE